MLLTDLVDVALVTVVEDIVTDGIQSVCNTLPFIFHIYVKYLMETRTHKALSIIEFIPQILIVKFKK